MTAVSTATAERTRKRRAHARKEDPPTWRMPATLTPAHLDARARIMPVGPSITIDVRQFVRCPPTVESRLLDLLTHLTRAGTEIRLLIAGAGRGALPQRYIRMFTESVAGFLLAELASSIVDERRTDLKAAAADSIQAKLTDSGGIIWKGGERTAPVCAREPLHTARLVSTGDPISTRQALSDELRHLSFSFRYDENSLLNLAACLYQAVDNIHEHAGSQLPAMQSDWLGFVSLRRIRQIDLTRVSSPSSATAGKQTAGAPHHLEIVVADNGSGIPATMAGSSAVYDHGDAIGLEQRLVHAALDKGTSIESPGVGRGLGLGKLMKAVKKLGGQVTVRSGRLQTRARRIGDRVVLSEQTTLPYPVGTTIMLVLPGPRASA